MDARSLSLKEYLKQMKDAQKRLGGIPVAHYLRLHTDPQLSELYQGMKRCLKVADDHEERLAAIKLLREEDQIQSYSDRERYSSPFTTFINAYDREKQANDKTFKAFNEYKQKITKPAHKYLEEHERAARSASYRRPDPENLKDYQNHVNPGVSDPHFHDQVIAVSKKHLKVVDVKTLYRIMNDCSTIIACSRAEPYSHRPDYHTVELYYSRIAILQEFQHRGIAPDVDAQIVSDCDEICTANFDHARTHAYEVRAKIKLRQGKLAEAKQDWDRYNERQHGKKDLSLYLDILNANDLQSISKADLLYIIRTYLPDDRDKVEKLISCFYLSTPLGRRFAVPDEAPTLDEVYAYLQTLSTPSVMLLHFEQSALARLFNACRANQLPEIVSAAERDPQLFRTARDGRDVNGCRVKRDPVSQLISDANAPVLSQIWPLLTRTAEERFDTLTSVFDDSIDYKFHALITQNTISGDEFRGLPQHVHDHFDNRPYLMISPIEILAYLRECVAVVKGLQTDLKSNEADDRYADFVGSKNKQHLNVALRVFPQHAGALLARAELIFSREERKDKISDVLKPVLQIPVSYKHYANVFHFFESVLARPDVVYADDLLAVIEKFSQEKQVIYLRRCMDKQFKYGIVRSKARKKLQALDPSYYDRAREIPESERYIEEGKRKEEDGAIDAAADNYLLAINYDDSSVAKGALLKLSREKILRPDTLFCRASHQISLVAAGLDYRQLIDAYPRFNNQLTPYFERVVLSPLTDINVEDVIYLFSRAVTAGRVNTVGLLHQFLFNVLTAAYQRQVLPVIPSKTKTMLVELVQAHCHPVHQVQLLSLLLETTCFLGVRADWHHGKTVEKFDMQRADLYFSFLLSPDLDKARSMESYLEEIHQYVVVDESGLHCLLPTYPAQEGLRIHGLISQLLQHPEFVEAKISPPFHAVINHTLWYEVERFIHAYTFYQQIPHSEREQEDMFDAFKSTLGRLVHEAGADITCQNAQQDTILMTLLTKLKGLPIVRELTAFVLDLHSEEQRRTLENKLNADKIGTIALCLKLYPQEADAYLGLIFAGGVTVNTPQPLAALSPLNVAARSPHPGVVVTLLQHDAPLAEVFAQSDSLACNNMHPVSRDLIFCLHEFRTELHRADVSMETKLAAYDLLTTKSSREENAHECEVAKCMLNVLNAHDVLALADVFIEAKDYIRAIQLMGAYLPLLQPLACRALAIERVVSCLQRSRETDLHEHANCWWSMQRFGAAWQADILHGLKVQDETFVANSCQQLIRSSATGFSAVTALLIQILLDEYSAVKTCTRVEEVDKLNAIMQLACEAKLSVDDIIPLTNTAMPANVVHTYIAHFYLTRADDLDIERAVYALLAQLPRVQEIDETDLDEYAALESSSLPFFRDTVIRVRESLDRVPTHGPGFCELRKLVDLLDAPFQLATPKKLEAEKSKEAGAASGSQLTKTALRDSEKLATQYAKTPESKTQSLVTDAAAKISDLILVRGSPNLSDLYTLSSTVSTWRMADKIAVITRVDAKLSLTRGATTASHLACFNLVLATLAIHARVPAFRFLTGEELRAAQDKQKAAATDGPAPTAPDDDGGAAPLPPYAPPASAPADQPPSYHDATNVLMWGAPPPVNQAAAAETRDSAPPAYSP